MAKDQAFRPSLLVGVGGMGSAIAQNVYDRAVKAGLVEQGRVRVLTFDTDENDTRRLDRLEGRQKIRFSDARGVDDLLDRHPDVERNWFVRPRTELPMELRKMTLMDGAGQVRILTRLALHDAYSRGLIESGLGSVISELGRYDNRAGFEGQINVLMAGSLAGATGSGSFLQVAAMINELARKRNVESSVYGLFLMPDIFVRTGVLPGGQIASVLANGYASLKEFHAATMKATERQGRFDFDFEFAPGRMLAAGDIPFKSLTLIDYEDMKGGNLGRSVPTYQRMAERAAFMLLFTPIGDEYSSVTANDVRQTTAAAARSTHNRIAAIGLSAIVYPHGSVVDYLRTRLAVALLEGDWLRLDRQFEARVRRFRDQRAAGNMTVVEPQQPQSYLEDLRQLALQDQIPFFREIHDRLNPMVSDGDSDPAPVPLEQTYLAAFDAQLVRTFWDGGDLAEIVQQGLADADQFASSAALTEEVRKRENRLDGYLRLVDQALVNRPNDIVVNLFSIADDFGEAEWREYHLQQYLVRSGPHLVQGRAFLFALRLALEKRLASLSADEVRKSLFKMANRFDKNRGAEPERRGSPAIFEEVGRIVRRGVVGRLLQGGNKEFVGEYVSYYNGSLKGIRDFAETKLREKAYRLLLAEVDELIRTANGLFKEIEDIIGTLRATVRDAETPPDRSVTTENIINVCADPDCLRSLWGEIETAIASQRLGEEINKVIARELYAAARRNRVNRNAEGLQKLRDLFRRTVVDGFAAQKVTGDYASVHDFSVVGAVKKQAAITKTDPAQLFRNLVGIVDRQSEVMVTLTNPSDGQAIQFWALHPSLRDEMSTFGDTDQLLKPSGQGTQTVEEEAFPTREMLSITLRVNLELAHLAKLSPPFRSDGSAAPDRAGRYYDEYQAMVTELINAGADKRVARTITPHIHRDWHKPGLLPEISEAETRRHVTNINKSFAVGIAFDLIRRTVNHDRRVAQVRTIGTVATGGISMEIADSHDMFRILEAFEHHPEAVRGCLHFLAEEVRRLEGTTDASVLARAADPKHVVTILLMAESRRDENRRDGRVADVVTGFAQLVHDLVTVTEPALPSRIQTDRANGKLVELGRAALPLLAEAGVPKENLEIMDTIYARGLERWRETAG